MMVEEKHSEFDFKCTKYAYIEKYKIPLQNAYGYGELVVQPVPLNATTAILLPFCLSKNAMRKVGELYSKTMFWAENLVYITLFIIYDMLLVPLVYIKMF